METRTPESATASLGLEDAGTKGAAAPPREPYVRPELIRHGTVEELTEKIGAVPDGDAGSFIP
ncbi:MAG TPA: hypothetical protein VGQ47_01325 [Candidatus Limnocylindrales bacterium]|nr:hypothetical protein [Candidatus Limnocylindrales bacterium]